MIQRHPLGLVLVLIMLQVVLWTAAPALTNLSFPLDVVREGLSWGQEWQWGYHKHPPLASWAANLSYEALGDLGPYLLSQLCIAVTYACVFALGRRLMDAPRAAVGTMLLAGVFYFSWPTPEFNHNVAQMPLWAGAILLLHTALTGQSARWWLALGAVAGIGLLVKYSMAVLLAAMALFLLARQPRLLLSRGVLGGAAVALLLLAPHLWWLVTHDFATIGYVQARAAESDGVLDGLGRFIGAQAADHLPLLLLLGLGGLVGRGAWRERPALPEAGFLWTMALGPFVLTVAAALLLGFEPRDMWGAPMWSLSGLLAVHVLGGRWDRLQERRLLGGVLALLLAVPALYAAISLWGTEWRGRAPKTAWPDRALAEALSAAWQAETGCPLRIVAGPNWLTGLVSARAPTRPSVLIDGDLGQSPWVTPERLAREGAAVIWTGEAMPAYADLPNAAPRGVLAIAWPRGPELAPLRVGWAVVPPADCKPGP